MMATSGCIEIWFLLKVDAVFHGDELQFRPILLHLFEAFEIVERVWVGGIFCLLIKLADPAGALGTGGQENVVRSLGGPPHEEILLAAGTLFALLVAVVKVCLPGQSHLLTEKAGAEVKRARESRDGPGAARVPFPTCMKPQARSRSSSSPGSLAVPEPTRKRWRLGGATVRAIPCGMTR